MKDNDFEITNDEISLLEIVDFFKEGWKIILLGGVVGGTLSAGYALLIPNTYQATASIQVAKVANYDVEAPNVLLEKMKMPSYYSPNTFVSCKIEKLNEPGRFLAKVLNPILAKNAPMISMQYKSRTAEEAKKCLEAVLVDIRSNQNELAKPILYTKKNQLSILKQKLQSAEEITQILSSKKSTFDFADSKFSASTLLLATTLSKENEVNDLRTQIHDLEIALSEPQTKSTYLTTPIYAPDIHVDPKRTLIASGGSIVGIVLAILLSFARYRVSPKSPC